MCPAAREENWLISWRNPIKIKLFWFVTVDWWDVEWMICWWASRPGNTYQSICACKTSVLSETLSRAISDSTFLLLGRNRGMSSGEFTHCLIVGSCLPLGNISVKANRLGLGSDFPLASGLVFVITKGFGPLPLWKMISGSFGNVFRFFSGGPECDPELPKERLVEGDFRLPCCCLCLSIGSTVGDDGISLWVSTIFISWFTVFFNSETSFCNASRRLISSSSLAIILCIEVFDRKWCETPLLIICVVCIFDISLRQFLLVLSHFGWVNMGTLS